jgi:hypothetical protein
MTSFRVHVYHAIHHNLTTHLPRSAATTLRNPPQKRQQSGLFSAIHHPKKIQF